MPGLVFTREEREAMALRIQREDEERRLRELTETQSIQARLDEIAAKNAEAEEDEGSSD